MDDNQRGFKQGVKTGVGATEERRVVGLRKQEQKRQDRLAMRRGRNHAPPMVDAKKRTDIVVFRELREQVKASLAVWFESGADISTEEGARHAVHAMEGLSTALFFHNRDLALSAYPDFFSGKHGNELLGRIATFVTLGPVDGSLGKLFRLGVSCATEIMYEPENIACVEVLCAHNIHNTALHHLFVVAPETSQMRQELLEMLGNTAR